MIPYHTWYSLVRLRRLMAAEVEASSPDKRAWVGVVPEEPDRYGIVHFEIPRRALANRQWLAPGDVHHVQEIEVSEEDLETSIIEILGDPALLVPPHQCDYPF